MSKSFGTTINIDGESVAVDFNFSPRVKERITADPGKSYPEEPAEWEIEYVYVGEVNITEWVSDKFLKRVEEALAEQWVPMPKDEPPEWERDW